MRNSDCYVPRCHVALLGPATRFSAGPDEPPLPPPAWARFLLRAIREVELRLRRSAVPVPVIAKKIRCYTCHGRAPSETA